MTKIVSCSETLLKEEIPYLKMVFTEINKYLKHIVDYIIRQELQNKMKSNEVNNDDRETHKIQIMLPNAGTTGRKLMTKVKNKLKKS